MKAVYFEYIIKKIRKRLAGWKARILSFGGRITLINYVLCSIPIYTMASNMVPKSVLKCIDKFMANILWNSQGESCAHWVSWESVCSPKEEGGLRIYKLDTVRNILNTKLLWLVLTGNCLWSRYAKSEYFRRWDPHNTSSQSPLWKSIISHYQTLGEHSRWIVGEDNLHCWSNNLCGERLCGPQLYDNTLLVTHGLTILDELWEFIPTHLRPLVSCISRDQMQPDRLVFTVAESGKFTFKAFRGVIRTQGRSRNWAKMIWHKSLLPNISAFLWKVLRHAVPVDSRIKTTGVIMAFLCHCCRFPEEESVAHLFLHSEVAQFGIFLGALCRCQYS